eukprot:1481783-Rhodomonas_salina.1
MWDKLDLLFSECARVHSVQKSSSVTLSTGNDITTLTSRILLVLGIPTRVPGYPETRDDDFCNLNQVECTDPSYFHRGKSQASSVLSSSNFNLSAWSFGVLTTRPAVQSSTTRNSL